MSNENVGVPPGYMEQEGYGIVRHPLPNVDLEANVLVPMRDGVELSIDIYRPEEPGQYPVLLSIAPYLKEIQQFPAMLCHSIEAGDTATFVRDGYIHVIANLRGTGFSKGQYDGIWTRTQANDGYDLIEWIAAQPWCDGNVGMVGDSYYAAIQWIIAATRPPHLKCIAPMDAGTDLYKIARPGGMPFNFFFGMWGMDTLAQIAWPGPLEGKEPPQNFLYDMMSHNEDDEFWRERSSIEKIDQIEVPCMSLVPAHGFLHTLTQLQAYPKIKAPKKLVVTPHAGHFAHVLLHDNFHLKEHLLKWFDHWLKGIDTGIMDEPEVAIFDNGTKEWIYEDEYPLARTEWKKYYLRSNPEQRLVQPSGLLKTEPAESPEPPDVIVMPQCMPAVAKGEPVLAYSTPSLDEDVRVCGPLSLVVNGASTTLDTCWFVKVQDEWPSGKREVLTEGALKASFRTVDRSKSKPGQPAHTWKEPVRPEPNKVYEYEVELTPIFHTFRKGHKIWVEIAVDNFAHHFPVHTIYTSEMVPVPAANQVFRDANFQSHLLLPVIPEAESKGPVEWPLSGCRFEVGYGKIVLLGNRHEKMSQEEFQTHWMEGTHAKTEHSFHDGTRRCVVSFLNGQMAKAKAGEAFPEASEKPMFDCMVELSGNLADMLASQTPEVEASKKALFEDELEMMMGDKYAFLFVEEHDLTEI